jgi:uncharacterized protein (DUF342 family)
MMTSANLTNNKNNNVDLVLLPAKSNVPVTEASIYTLIKESDYRDLFVISENIKNAVAELNTQMKTLTSGVTTVEIRYEILQRKDATITFSVESDDMSATGVINTALGGHHLSAKAILDAALKEGIKKGFIKEALIRLAKQAAKAESDTVVKEVIAKGKTPINGKNSKIKHLVESAQSRILKPREKEDGSVDMRDLGDIICVKVGEPLAQRIPFTEGFKGYTVKGDPLEPTPGEDCQLIAGDGTAFSPENEDLLISLMVGLPKIIDGGMAVDKVYKIRDVDVTTGHIEFEGSVLISGDVKEGMRVIASGDISVTGFVESATLDAGGDITISKGIIGRKQDVENNNNINDLQMSAIVNAKGNIFATYSQYTEINCDGDIRIENQLMHNIVHVGGRLCVGTEENHNGKLIGGYINAGTSVHAGIIGATAGSKTIVEFNKIINELKSELEQIDARFQHESDKSNELKDIAKKLKDLPKDKAKPEMLAKVVSTYQHHCKQMAKILSEKELVEQAVQNYMAGVYLEATDKIYQGVQLIVGDFQDRSKREYGPSKMVYRERKIHIEPIIHTS